MSPRPGPRRAPLNVRVSDADRAQIQLRAACELGRGRLTSEMARRLLTYGLRHMPAGWSPEQEETISKNGATDG